MFLRDYWYACAWPHEIGRAPLARRILNEPVVLYRTEAGAPVALADMCAHRQAPLSRGTVVGDALRCGYHGFLFDPSGRCTSVPGQTMIPDTARVRAYTVAEKWGLVWIWMGAREAADQALIPDAHWMVQPGWVGVGDRLPIACRYELMRDNLLDLSHLTYLHPNSIGTDSIAETPVRTSVEGDRVWIIREICDTLAPPTFRQWGAPAGAVDRWQMMHWDAPANIIIESKVLAAGTNDDSRGIVFCILNFITPETDRSCHYFWAQARNFLPDDEALSAELKAGLHAIFLEDKAMAEAQDERMREFPDLPGASARFDSGQLQVRRIAQRLLAEPTGSAMRLHGAR